MSNLSIVVVLVFTVIVSSKAATLRFQSPLVEAHVTLSENGEFVLSEGVTKSPKVAEFNLYLNTNKTGWNYAYGWTNGSYRDVVQAYTVGFLEGSTDPLIPLHYRNTMGGQCTSPSSDFCRNLLNYLTTNLKFMKKQIMTRRSIDPFWHQVELLLWQVQGLDDAFKKKKMRPQSDIVPSKLDLDPFGMFLWHVAGGDMEELSEALKPKEQRKSDVEMVNGFGHCSALIKQTPGPSGQLFVAQDTWTGYNSMLRHMKLYEFNYRETARPNSKFIAGVSQSFSGYPGSVVSGDDFYVLGSRMITQETTNGFYNTTLYDIISESAGKVVFEFLRSQVANRLARNISQWQKFFSHLNSGTYNNQWMVVDYKAVRRGRPLPSSGVLGVSEQLPGIVVSKDMTHQLQNTSYWPSYNTPSFPEIFNRSNMTYMVDKYGDFFTYEMTPRARIFRRDHHKVVDVRTMIRMMRYNDFKHDPLSRCNCTPPYSGENGISARCDLNPANGTYPFSTLGHRNHGATDMKLAVPWLLNHVGFIGVSSPTYDYLPPFRWSTSGFNVSHFGQPDVWQFKPMVTPWVKVQERRPTEKSFVLTPQQLIIFTN